MSDKYKHFARTFREYKALGSKYEVQAMFTLLDFEKTTVCWKTTPSKRFNEVIRDEHFCTISRFRAFKQAASIFTRTEISKLGVDAVCLIARQPTKYRARITRDAMKFRGVHSMEPTYQFTTRLIASIVPRQKNRPTYAQLKRLVETMKEELQRLGGQIPKMPTSKKDK